MPNPTIRNAITFRLNLSNNKYEKRNSNEPRTAPTLINLLKECELFFLKTYFF